MAVARTTSALSTSRPSQAAPLTAQAGSMPIPPWIQFFIALWVRTGSQTGINAQTVSDDLDSLYVLDTAYGAPEPTPIPPLPIAITPGSSPYAYQAPFGGYVNLSGGTVSAVTVSRDGGTTNLVVPHAGQIMVAQGDVVTVTYSGAPTMYMVGL